MINYVTGCAGGTFFDEYKKDPISFINRFPSILKRDCTSGQRDCNECVWGGNDYDPYLADIFNVPVISVRMERRGKDENIICNSMEVRSLSTWEERYIDTDPIKSIHLTSYIRFHKRHIKYMVVICIARYSRSTTNI